jgi:hypothetical protein
VNLLRIIPAYRKLESENKQILADRDALQSTLNKSKPRHMVFFHLLRTGGSSTWSALVAAAGRAGLPVCDLYHQSRQEYGDNLAIHATMYDFQRFVRKHDCLIHHHIPHCLAPYFDEPICYTTILRDPVDRFISEVNHVRHLLNGEVDTLHMQGRITPYEEILGLGWTKELLDMAADESIEFSKVLLTAADHPHFCRYYSGWFNRLLNVELSKQTYESALASTISPATLAEQIRGEFAYIGSFKTLEESIRDIATRYGLTGVGTSEWLNNRMSGNILPELRASLKPAFAEDYELIKALGIDV